MSDRAERINRIIHLLDWDNRIFQKKLLITVAFIGLVFSFSLPSLAQTVIVIYKHELQLEVWKNGSIKKQWEICKLSKLAGRKTKEGDKLVPEGIYEVDSYNSKSASHKTLHINYPNAFDRSQGSSGGSIGIHGKCSSVGCIGMSNQQMDEIVKALKSELKDLPIPVLIYYTSQSSRVDNLIKLYRKRGNASAATFLDRMEKVRAFWNEHHRVPNYTWDARGYVLKE